MPNRAPPLLDVTPDGRFALVPQARPTWPLRVGIGAAIVAVAATALVAAALLLWVASVLLPVALVAGAIAFGMFRYQAWRSGPRQR